MSQALGRIRQAARQRTKEKFTALFHHLTIDLLENAFDELKEDAAAGVDGLTWRESRDMSDHGFRAFRMMLDRLDAATGRGPQHHRTGQAAAGAGAQARGVIENLVDADIGKIKF